MFFFIDSASVAVLDLGAVLFGPMSNAALVVVPILSNVPVLVH